jgi:hypothetical protein
VRLAAEKERFVTYVRDTTGRLKRKAEQLREQSNTLKVSAPAESVRAVSVPADSLY